MDEDNITTKEELRQYTEYTESDVKKDSMSVHGSISKWLSRDFVMACFSNEKDVTYVIEMVSIVRKIEYTCNNFIEVGKRNKAKGYDGISSDIIYKIKQDKRHLIGLFMDRINALAILRRNQVNNPLVQNVLGVISREMEEEEEKDSMQKIAESLKSKLANQEKLAS